MRNVRICLTRKSRFRQPKAYEIPPVAPFEPVAHVVLFGRRVGFSTFDRSLAFLASVMLAHAPATAFAQTEPAMVTHDSAPNAERADGVDRSAPRLRFGVSGGLALGKALSARVDSFALTPTLVIDLGVQLGDDWALYGHAAGGSLLFLNQGEAYLVGEWTPRRWVSFGTGIGYDGMSVELVCDCQGTRSNWSGVSVPLLIGFNFGSPRADQARRAFWRLGFEGAGGVEPATGTLGWHGGLAFGGAWM
jgi:hypothetical protein